MIGRKKEYQLLQRLYDSDSFELLVMYGRRRVGKTYLLVSFLSTHAGVYFMAKEKDDAGNLASLWKALARFYGGIPSFAYPKTLSDVLDYIDGDPRDLFLVLDEYQWLGENMANLNSILQEYADKWKRERRRIKIVLCGSVISMMRNLVDDKQSPLYGRHSAKLELLPFSYDEMCEFLPESSSKERLEAYMMSGGIPYYLEFYSPGDTPASFIRDNLVEVTGALRDEMETLVKEEVRKSGPYLRLLRLLGSGNTTFAELSPHFEGKSSLLSSYLDTLETKLCLIEKVEPALGGKGKTHYRIRDLFCLLYFTLIYPNTDDPSYYLNPDVFAERYLSEERTSTFFGMAFERVCQSFLDARSASSLLPCPYPRFRNHWEASHEFDLASLTKKNELALGECKWTNKELSAAKYFEMLQYAADHNLGENAHYYFFSRGGFSERLLELAKQETNVHLFGLDDLF